MKCRGFERIESKVWQKDTQTDRHMAKSANPLSISLKHKISRMTLWRETRIAKEIFLKQFNVLKYLKDTTALMGTSNINV